MNLQKLPLILSLLTVAAGVCAQVTLSAPPMKPPVYMAKMACVQAELALTDDQKAKIEAAVPKPVPPPHRDSQEIKQQGDEPPAVRKDPFDFDEVYSKVKEILTPKQIERLEQLNRQYYGVYSMTYPANVKEYGLSTDQIDRLKTAYTEALEEVASSSLVTENGVTKVVITSKGMAQASESCMKEAKQILTAGQLKKFADSLGAPFKFEDK